eukprot:gene5165-3713_t
MELYLSIGYFFLRVSSEGWDTLNSSATFLTLPRLLIRTSPTQSPQAFGMTGENDPTGESTTEELVAQPSEMSVISPLPQRQLKETVLLAEILLVPLGAKLVTPLRCCRYQCHGYAASSPPHLLYLLLCVSFHFGTAARQSKPIEFGSDALVSFRSTGCGTSVPIRSKVPHPQCPSAARGRRDRQRVPTLGETPAWKYRTSISHMLFGPSTAWVDPLRLDPSAEVCRWRWRTRFYSAIPHSAVVTRWVDLQLWTQRLLHARRGWITTQEPVPYGEVTQRWIAVFAVQCKAESSISRSPKVVKRRCKSMHVQVELRLLHFPWLIVIISTPLDNDDRLRCCRYQCHGYAASSPPHLLYLLLCVSFHFGTAARQSKPIEFGSDALVSFRSTGCGTSVPIRSKVPHPQCPSAARGRRDRQRVPTLGETPAWKYRTSISHMLFGPSTAWVDPLRLDPSAEVCRWRWRTRFYSAIPHSAVVTRWVDLCSHERYRADPRGTARDAEEGLDSYGHSVCYMQEGAGSPLRSRCLMGNAKLNQASAGVRRSLRGAANPCTSRLSFACFTFRGCGHEVILHFFDSISFLLLLLFGCLFAALFFFVLVLIIWVTPLDNDDRLRCCRYQCHGYAASSPPHLLYLLLCVSFHFGTAARQSKPIEFGSDALVSFRSTGCGTSVPIRSKVPHPQCPSAARGRRDRQRVPTLGETPAWKYRTSISHMLFGPSTAWVDPLRLDPSAEVCRWRWRTRFYSAIPHSAVVTRWVDLQLWTQRLLHARRGWITTQEPVPYGEVTQRWIAVFAVQCKAESSISRSPKVVKRRCKSMHVQSIVLVEALFGSVRCCEFEIRVSSSRVGLRVKFAHCLRKMPSASALRDEILEVFKIFDEDDSGMISILEFRRALYAIIGERIPRSEVVRLVNDARQHINDRKADRFSPKSGSDMMSPRPGDEDFDASPLQSKSTTGTSGATGMTWKVEEDSESVSPEVFEHVVLMKLNARSYADELASTFVLLEDKYYPGFITKESLMRTAAETEEPLTEAEVLEMFDPLVTGVPTAAVDFQTFCNIQAAARKLEEQ